MLLWELYEKATRLGYEVGDRRVAPKSVYGLVDLIACLDDNDIQASYSTRRYAPYGSVCAPGTATRCSKATQAHR